MRRFRPLAATIIAALVATLLVSQSAAAKPDPQETARKIDESLAKEVFKEGVKLAPRSDDATFLRRAWIDVVGDIPAPEQGIAFALDKSPDKRQKVVNELLANPQYGLNWARYWRDVIFYRRIEDRALIAANSLEADLSDDLNENEPWDRVASQFITATGDVRDHGETALIMAQEGRTEETTAEVARIFLGIQIQCAQCHDHPYDHWKREQFHELAAFFPRIGVRPVISVTKRSFQVVASDNVSRVPKNDDGNRPTAEHYMPDLKKPSDPGTRMQPKFFLTGATLPYGSLDVDRRETLAKWLTGNKWFSVALVNRMWAELVGEGFYDPIDDVGPDRTARAPETLKILADGFHASGYDVKWLVETICSTDAYQRQSRPREHGEEHVPFTSNVPQPLRADQLYNAVVSALDIADAPQERINRPGKADRNAGPRRQFNQTFGFDPSEPRESISGSIPQALAMMNSPQVAGALKANKRGVLGTLIKDIKDNDELFTELYLRTLSRQPTADELARAEAYIDEVDSRATAVEDISWVLLNSAEFRYRR